MNLLRKILGRLGRLREPFARRTLLTMARTWQLEKLPVPPDPAYPMSYCALHETFKELERVRPQLIVELGSGCSTVLLSAYARAHQIQVVSVEHNPKYRDLTEKMLKHHSVEGPHVNLVEAPLKSYTLKGSAFRWYDVNAVSLKDGTVDFLIVDGPPGNFQQFARYPALPLLWSKLAPNAHIILDDANRPDEIQICRDWLAEFPSLSLQTSQLGRGLAKFVNGPDKA